MEAVPDSIRIEQLEVFGAIGVTDRERANPQRLTLTMTLSLSVTSESLADDITQTVNYSAVCAEAREFTRTNSFALIETLASRLAAHLLGRFPVRAIQIELRKFVLPDAKYVAITLVRSSP